MVRKELWYEKAETLRNAEDISRWWGIIWHDKEVV